MAETLVDIALEFNASYSQAIRNKVKKTRKEIFLGILKTLFQIYGRSFEYDDSSNGLSAFKSDVIRVKNRLKKAKENFAPKPSWNEHPDPPESSWLARKFKPAIQMEEGDVVWEAENLGTEDPYN